MPKIIEGHTPGAQLNAGAAHKAKQAAQRGNISFLLAGEVRESPHTVDVRSPFDQHVIASVCQATEADAEEALAAAAVAFQLTRKLTSARRSEICAAVADRIEAESADIAKGIALEAGKPMTDATREVTRAIDTFRIAAEEAKRIGGSVLALDWPSPATSSPTQRTGIGRRFSPSGRSSVSRPSIFL